MTAVQHIVEHHQTRSTRQRMAMTAILCAAFVAGMVGMAFAAVPLYQLFCQVTGFAGTTQVATEAPATVIDRDVVVRFDANISDDLGWSFRPITRAIELKAGEKATALFRAENRSSRTTTGSAVFNVSPLTIGAYFNKIECFCFTEQTLAPGESIDMPVTFFVDPAIADDSDADGVHTITLSYTFYSAEPTPAAGSAEDNNAF